MDATAESLPFDDCAFDAAMTTFSVHQWGDLQAGLREMRRVTRGPVAILTCDPDLVRDFWPYAPEVLDTEARPEALLDPAARLSCSAWSFPGPEVHERFTRELSRDLADGRGIGGTATSAPSPLSTGP